MDIKEKVYEKATLIKVEDFLLYFNKAYERDNIKALSQLYDLFPETAELAFDENYLDTLNDPVDYEYQYIHPIIIESNRMTQQRVLDMVAYLLGKNKAPDKYKRILEERIVFSRVFNYHLGRYHRDYNKNALWNSFFMKLPELRFVIERRYIKSLEELVYRASNYYERYQQY